MGDGELLRNTEIVYDTEKLIFIIIFVSQSQNHNHTTTASFLLVASPPLLQFLYNRALILPMRWHSAIIIMYAHILTLCTSSNQNISQCAAFTCFFVWGSKSQLIFWGWAVTLFYSNSCRISSVNTIESLIWCMVDGMSLFTFYKKKKNFCPLTRFLLELKFICKLQKAKSWEIFLVDCEQASFHQTKGKQ